MAISRAHPRLGEAVGCVLGQSGVETALLLIVNGPDRQAALAAESLASGDARIRVLFREEPGLSGALNLALRSTNAEFVARMDDDDRCEPHRLDIQFRQMRERPGLAAVGCAWRVLGPDGRSVSLVRPPTEPAELFARLLEGNCLAHGSMLLRRGAVLDAGGYDESLDKAQDLDLWLRLGARGAIGAVPDLLYTHILREGGRSMATSRAQAASAAKVLARAWAALPRGDDPELLEAVADVLVSPDRAGVGRVNKLIASRGPTLGAMIAGLWAARHAPPIERRAIEVCRRSRLREVGDRLRQLGATSVTLWGAGDHAEWIIAHASDLGLPITGVVDDHAAGERFGFQIERPASLSPGSFVLIASDSFEDRIWEGSEPHRARGVRVFRLYAD